jgi:hypothetical protein
MNTNSTKYSKFLCQQSQKFECCACTHKTSRGTLAPVPALSLRHIPRRAASDSRVCVKPASASLTSIRDCLPPGIRRVANEAGISLWGCVKFQVG